MKKAILVMDMQKACVGKEHNKFFKYNQGIIENVNAVINENDNIIYIKNLMKNSLINKLAPVKVFAGNPEAELVDEIVKKGDVAFEKYKGDAFSNPNLEKYLTENEIDTIEIVGVDGVGCVYYTALGGLKKNFKVVINTKAIDTMFPKKQTKSFETLKNKGAEIK